MRRPLRIVVPLVMVGIVAVWWAWGEQPSPVSSREPVPAQDLRPTASPGGTLRSNRPGKEENRATGLARTAAIPAPFVEGEAPQQYGDDATASGNGAALQPAQIRWEGPAITSAGVPFAVALRMTSDEPVRVVRMQLRFDPDLLQVVSVRAGEYLGAANFGHHIGPNGSIRFGASIPASAPAADAALVVVTFKPVKTGIAELSLSALHPEGPAHPIVYDGVMPFTTTITP